MSQKTLVLSSNDLIHSEFDLSNSTHAIHARNLELSRLPVLRTKRIGMCIRPQLPLGL